MKEPLYLGRFLSLSKSRIRWCFEMLLQNLQGSYGSNIHLQMINLTRFNSYVGNWASELTFYNLMEIEKRNIQHTKFLHVCVPGFALVLTP